MPALGSSPPFSAAALHVLPARRHLFLLVLKHDESNIDIQPCTGGAELLRGNGGGGDLALQLLHKLLEMGKRPGAE